MPNVSVCVFMNSCWEYAGYSVCLVYCIDVPMCGYCSCSYVNTVYYILHVWQPELCVVYTINHKQILDTIWGPHIIVYRVLYPIRKNSSSIRLILKMYRCRRVHILHMCAFVSFIRSNIKFAVAFCLYCVINTGDGFDAQLPFSWPITLVTRR
jgi:hypothetical protein